MKNERKKKVLFRERSPFIFPSHSSLLRSLSLSSNRFPLSLLFIFSFSFKSFWVHVIFNFLARKSTGCEKIHRSPMEHSVLRMIFWSQNHRSWKNPPGTCGTPYFVSSDSLYKTTGRGKIHQAPMEQTVLKLASSEATSTSRGRLHQALVEHTVLRLTYSFQTCLHKQRTNPNVWSETR